MPSSFSFTQGSCFAAKGQGSGRFRGKQWSAAFLVLAFLSLTALLRADTPPQIILNGPSTVARFTALGNSIFTVPAGVTNLDYVIVGGGGGGGGNRGGGGGAGGVRSGKFEVSPGQQIVVVVGAGGAPGVSGADSILSNPAISFSITASGGGHGGEVNAAGADGGSGGGHGAGTNLAPSFSIPVAGDAQGSSGASGSASASYGSGGGGGGFSGVGGTGISGPAASFSNIGGPGYTESLTGTSLSLAGGGGGGVQRSNNASDGGLATPGFGGGNGSGTVAAGDGQPGTGGGGGGGGSTVSGSGSSGGSGGSGTVILSYRTFNDAFANRYPLVDFAFATNVGATKEAGEPFHGGSPGGASVWWTWTAPESGTYTLSTQGSNFDTTLGVYTGTAVNALTYVADNDDSEFDTTSRVVFNATAGTTYQIAVDSFYVGNVGNIALSLSFTPPVPVPSLGPVTFSGFVGETIPLTSDRFINAFTDPSSAPLDSITILSLPEPGMLQYLGSAVEVGQFIPASDLGNLVYVAPTVGAGIRDFNVSASNGSQSSAPAAVTLNIIPVPASVVVVSIPSTYINTNGEVTFTDSLSLPPGVEVVGVDFDLEYSTYWPPSNPALAGNYVRVNGTEIGQLGWASLGNNNGWTPLSRRLRGPLPAYNAGAQNTWTIGSAYNPITVRNLTIRVYYTGGVINQPPTLGPIARSGLANTTVAFTASNFTDAYSDPEAAPLFGITVVTLPASGTLKLAGANVTAGQVIPVASLGELIYVPALNAAGAVTFTVTASDSALSSTAATVTITLAAPADDTPPVLTSVSIASSNATPTLAKPGDTITVTFTANEPLGPTAAATLRGWYPLDGNGLDPTLTGPALTLPGQPVPFTSGLAGQAASFDGTGNGWFRAAINASGETNSTFTWGTWAKLTDTVNWSILISNDDNDWDRFLASYNGKWTVPKGGTLESPSDVTTAWTFLAVTYDGTTQRLYVDGNPVFTAPDPGNQPMQPFIEIGRNANGFYPINGLIDGVFFFDDTLTAAQVATIRAGGPGGSGVFKLAGKPVVATIAGRPATVTQVSGNTWSASLTLAATDPAGPVAFSLTCIDAAGNVAAPVTATTNGSAVQADITGPAVVSIARQNASPTGATSVAYTVTFSESVTGVDAADFALAFTGATSASIGSVTGSGATYTVTINSILSGGTLRLDLKATGTGIADAAGNLVATGFTGGEVYTISPSAPTLTAPTTATLAEDTVLNFTGSNGVVVGDIDNNLSTLSITATKGTLTLTGSPSTTNTGLGTAAVAFRGSASAINASISTLRYTPADDYNGPDTVTFVASDSTELTATKTVALTITSVADIAADTLTTAEDTSVTANLLTGAGGASADTFKSSAAFIFSVTQGAHGSVTFAGNGTITYTPALNYNGADSFTYTVSSGGVTETGPVNITVTAVNDAPTLAAIALAGTEDTTFTFTAANFTSAYADIETTPLASITAATLPASGALKLAGVTVTAGQVIPAASLANLTYVPVANANGAITFTVTASDGGLSSAPATVTLTLAAVNDAPTLAAISLEGIEDTTFTFTAANFTSAYADIEATPLASITVATLPATGTLKLSGVNVTAGQVIPAASLANLTYVPAANANGAITFTVTASDGALSSASTTVTLTLAAVNDAPTQTAPATAIFAEDTSFSFTGSNAITVADVDDNLTSTHLEVGRGKLSVSLAGGATLSSGASGSPSLTLGGTIAQINAALATLVYTPSADYNGGDSLLVQSIDSGGLIAQSNIALTITSVADVAHDTLATGEDNAITANVLTGTNGASADSFSDPAAIVLAVTQGAHGSVTFAGNGTVTYTPALNFNGTDTFTYTVAAGFGTETGVVTVNVSAVNDAPVNTVPGAQSVNANTSLAFSAATGNAISIADADFANVAPEVAEPFKFSVTLTATHGAIALGSTTGLTFTSGTGAPSLTLEFSGSLSAVNAALSTLTFLPTPGFSGAASLTITTSDNSNTGSGGALTDTDTIAITVIDTIPPVVVSLASLTPDGHYRAGAVIDLAVTFSETVSVNLTGGTPTLLLETGATDRTATYVSGSSSSVLVFRYVAIAGDTSEDLNHQSTTALTLNGARLQDLAGNDAILTLPSTASGTPGALATNAALVIDTTAPTVAISAPSATTASLGPVTYTITYADAHFAASTLSVADITLNRTSTDARLVTANATVTVGGSGLTRTVTLSNVTGDGLLSISLAAGTATDLAGNPAPAVGPAAAITVQNTFPIAIVQSPVSATVAVGMPLILRVTATGTAPAFQWYKDTLPIEGATKATLEFAATPLSAAGSYRVTVGNVLGAVDSAVATVGVVDVTAAHAIDGPGFVPGQTVTVRNVVTFSGGDGTLTWSLLLPPGWSYVGGELAGDTRPVVGATDLLEWSWSSFPLSPVTFSAQLQVPAGASGSQLLAAHVTFTRAGTTVPLLAKPDPLVLAEIGIHSADTDRNGRFSLFELLRVIELYNTRVGTVRTGGYAVATGPSEDGFAPALTRPLGATAPLEVYHVADTDRDGVFSLLELTRVIELYNYRQGTLRTGEYHRQAGTEDGFASGPGGSSP